MDEKQKCFLSAVVYVHNGGKTIRDFLIMLYHELVENFEHFEIICVDDSSTDDSVIQIKEAAKTMEEATLNLLYMSYFQGIELSMNAGTDLAIGDYVFEFDTPDYDYDKGMIMKIFRMAQTGFDIVSACPEKKQRFSSTFFYALFNKGTTGKYKMRTESFRIVSRRVINRVGSMNKTIPYRKAVYASSGLPVKSLVYECVKTQERGKDKLEDSYRKELAANTLILFTDLGYHFSIRMTLIMMLITLFTGIYAFIFYVCGTPIEGWTTTMLFMSAAFFGLFGILTIIVKYLSVIVGLLFRRQQYMVEGLEKITK